MDDSFLFSARRNPAPEYARALRAALDASERTNRARGAHERILKWAAAAASVAIVSAAFTFPAVRAGAEAFLDLFRVMNFAGVSFDAKRLQEMSQGLDLRNLIGDGVEVLEEPGPPISFESAADASAASGLKLVAPTWLPPGWQQQRIEVTAPRASLRALPGCRASWMSSGSTTYRRLSGSTANKSR